MNMLARVGQFLASVSGFLDPRFWPTDRRSGGPRTASSEPVTQETALNYSACWAATRLLCGTGASLPLPVFSGDEIEERVKQRTHPLSKILNRQANPEMTAFNFRSLMWQWQVNWGTGYAEIEREGDTPDGAIKALWPVHPDRVTPKRNEAGELYFEVRNSGGGDPVPVPSWRMFYLPSIITHDGITGRGVITHARETIGAGLAMEKYGANWFGGAGVPRGVVKVAGNWSPEARADFKEDWEDVLSGPTGSRVAILQGGAEFTPVTINANDSQFLESRGFTVEEFSRWYGIPPHLLHYLIHATLNNVEHLGISFVQYSLLPWLCIWEQCIQSQLFTASERGDYFAEHNVDALLRGDHQSRANYYTAMLNAAIMTRNEVRKKENLDPVEGGDTFLVQGATVPLDTDGKPQSDFAGTAQAPVTPPADDNSDDGSNNKSVTHIVDKLKYVIQHDLTRFLTKESKAMANFAKKPSEFLNLIEHFYSEQRVSLTDEVAPTFSAISACGLDVDVHSFVATWVDSGKSAMVAASGTATATELPAAVQMTLESMTWTDRPNHAVEAL